MILIDLHQVPADLVRFTGEILNEKLHFLCLLPVIRYFMQMILAWYSSIITEIEKQPLRDFSSLCDWFVDNKLSVHFGQEKTKSILFGTKHKLRNAKTLNIVCNGTAIKQYEKVKYRGCIIDQNLSGESMALNVIDKVNSRLKFLHRQNRFLIPSFMGCTDSTSF